MATRAKAGSNGRTWTQLKKAYENLPENFDNLCKKIYETYARSDYFTDIKAICSQFTIAPSCFSRIQDYVIIEDLVSDDTINLAETKAVRNQQTHHQLAGKSTSTKVGNALKQRAIRRREKDEEKLHEEWVMFFTKFTISGLSFEDYANREGKTYEEAFDLFTKCICLNLFDEDLINAIRINCDSLNGLTKKQKANNKAFFDGLAMISNAYKNGFTL